MFPGQGWQFFTWNCNVGDTWSVQLATALCNLAVSREEEIPPPNPSGFSCSAMKMPPRAGGAGAWCDKFLSSQPTCNSVLGLGKGWNFPKVAPTKPKSASKPHWRWQTTSKALQTRFNWTRKGWVEFNPYQEQAQVSQWVLQGQTCRSHHGHPHKVTAATPFCQDHKFCRWSPTLLDRTPG